MIQFNFLENSLNTSVATACLVGISKAADILCHDIANTLALFKAWKILRSEMDLRPVITLATILFSMVKMTLGFKLFSDNLSQVVPIS